MATVWERTAHSVYSMFSLYFDIVILVISHFGFEGETLVLIAAVSGHCFSFTFSTTCIYISAFDRTTNYENSLILQEIP